MKLELKRLAGYLPYGLKAEIEHNDIRTIEEITGIDFRCAFPNNYFIFGNIEGWSRIGDKKVLLSSSKPILRPLSDLAKEIEDGLTYYDVLRIDFDKNGVNGFDFYYLQETPLEYPFYIVQKLIEWHFDVFGLIDKGLAIDINTLNNLKTLSN
jgi:hypothetical protein